MTKESLSVLQSAAKRRGYRLQQDKDGIMLSGNGAMMCFDHTEDDIFRLCAFLMTGRHPMLVELN